MSFFSKFPLVSTSTYLRKNILITDIFQRIAVNNRIRDIGVLLIPYIVLDGETPDIVANKLYGNPTMHWTILHVNNIINPYLEWPVTSSDLDKLVFDKYPFQVTVSEEDSEKFEIGDEVRVRPEGTLTVIDKLDNVIFLQSTVAKVTYITVNSRLSVGTETNIQVLSVVDPTEGIHHYEDTSTGLIVEYDNTSPFIIPVTNYDYEVELNDAKRSIRVLDNRYLQLFEREFNSLIR